MVGTVELVMFAIQSAVKLVRAGRTVYVEQSITREIVFPLPATLDSPRAHAVAHAERIKATDPKRFNKVFKPAYTRASSGATAEDRERASQELMQLYLLDLADGLVPTFKGDTQEIAGMLAVREWTAAESPFPQPLQRIAGALIEVAVDYFAGVPGAVDDTSRQGKTIRAFLKGIDDVDLQSASWDKIAVALFTAGLDTVKDYPDLLAEDDEDQDLLSAVVAGVANDVKSHLAKLPPEGDMDAVARIGRFSQMLLRSVLRNAGSTLLDNPAALGVTDGGGQALVQGVGSALLDLLLSDTGDDGTFDIAAAMQRTVSTGGMDRLISAAVKAAAEHPDLFRIKDDAVRTWLKDVLTGLYAGSQAGLSFFDPDIFSQVAFVIVDTGLKDLPTMLDPGDGSSAILVAVARAVFDAVAQPGAGGKPPRWRLDLSRTEVKDLFAAAVGAVAAHPEWLASKPANQKKVAAWLGLAVQTLIAVDNWSLKSLLRAGQLQGVLTAALTSGLLGDLEPRALANVASALADVVAAVRSQGVAGLADLVLDPGRLTDLLTAVVQSGILDELLDDATVEKATIGRLVAGLQLSRQVGPPTVKQLVDAIKA